MKILRRNKKPDDDDVNVVLQDIRLNIVSALIHLICDPPCSRGLCCCGVTKAPFAMKQSVLSAGHAFSSVLCLPNCLLFFYIVCCSRKRWSQHTPKSWLPAEVHWNQSYSWWFTHLSSLRSQCPWLSRPEYSLSQHLNSSLTLAISVFHAQQGFWNALQQSSHFKILCICSDTLSSHVLAKFDWWIWLSFISDAAVTEEALGICAWAWHAAIMSTSQTNWTSHSISHSWVPYRWPSVSTN